MKLNPNRDRLVDQLLREVLGNETPPDVADRVLRKAYPRRKVIFWAAPAAAAAVLLIVGAWLAFSPRYPLPLLDGKPIEREAVVSTHEKARDLILGGYAHVALQPEASIRIKGSQKDERIALEKGKVTCRVNREQGRFTVETTLGNVWVTGTEFSVELIDKKGEEEMIGNKAGRALALAIIVTAGTVQVDYEGSRYAISAGQSQVFGGERKEVSQDPPKKRTPGKDGEKNAIAKGTVIGTVVAKGDSSITIRSLNGNKDEYIPEWEGGNTGGPKKSVVRQIKAVKVGDKVRAQWYVNDHLRLKSVERIEGESKEDGATEKSREEGKKEEKGAVTKKDADDDDNGDDDDDEKPIAGTEGFSGKVSGTVQSKDENGDSFTLKVKDILKTWKGNKAKNPKAMVGETIEIEGINENHLLWIKTLKEGDAIEIEIRYNEENDFQILELSESQRKTIGK
ncbi:MAG: FecR domain-containing protein [Planctomycetes bacterium]|nr:FecR domain-containing protein [Planctomycetota bacterium]